MSNRVGIAALAALALLAIGSTGARATVSAVIGTPTTQAAIAQCSGNQVMVGLYAGVTDRVVALTPVCADASSGPWNASTPGAQLGSGGSEADSRMCFAPQALYGAQAAVRKSDGAIVGLKIICGSSPFNDDVGDMTGGAGIGKTAVVCGPGLTAIGIRAWFTDAAHTTVSGFAFQCLTAPASVGGVAAPAPAAGGSGSSAASSTSGGGGTAASGGVAAISFAGAWNVHASDGTSFVMNLTQTGNKVSGTYDTGGRDGEIRGSVSGNVFIYTWKLTGATKANGSGSMTLAPGGKSWSGTFMVASPIPGIGSWKGSL